MTLARLILGLLSLSPMTGYELKKHFDATVSHFWAADKAQIYRTLASLVRDGLCEVETVQQENYPARQVHHITDAGRAVLKDWLESEPQPDAERNAFLGRMFFASQLGEEPVRKLLQGRRIAAERYLGSLAGQLEAHGPVAAGDPKYFQLATLRNGISHVRAELGWLQDIEGELS